ncbi:MAG: acyltransferase family protein [Methanobacteriaceae archaeon]
MRKYYLDTLRLLTIFLVIILHIFLIYSALPYYVKVGETNNFLTLVIYLLLVWLMPLLFAIAGITSYYSLRKRNMKEYFKERVQRLLIPFIAAMIFLNPILSYFGIKFHENISMNYFDYYLHSFRITDLTGYDGGLTFGPAWFILFLFIVSCLAIPIIKLLKNKVDLSNKDFSIVTLVLFGVIPVILYPILTLGGGKSIGLSLGFFMLGYYVLSNDNVMKKLEKNKVLLGIIVLILTAIFIVAVLLEGSAFSIAFDSISYYYQAFYGWVSILLILVLGKMFLNKTNNIIQYLSESSFTLYIFHESILIAVAFYIIQFTSNIYLQMLLILILTISLSMGLYVLCKRFKISRFLFGIK